MPLIPQDNSVKTTKSDPQQMVFLVTSPKFSISELILSKETFDEIETVIKAQEYWNIVFEEWNL